MIGSNPIGPGSNPGGRVILEDWLSGLRQRFAKPSEGKSSPRGSNPLSSAIFLFTLEQKFGILLKIDIIGIKYV